MSGAAVLTLDTIGDRLRPIVEGHLGAFFRTVSRGHGATETPAAAWISTGEAHPFANLAVVDPNDASGVRDAIGALAGVGQPSAIAVLGAGSDEVVAALAEAGYVEGEEEIAMALDLAALSDAPVPAGYEFVEVRAGAEASSWNDAFAGGYEVPPGIAAVFGPAGGLRDAGVRHYGLRKDGVVVATAALFTGGGMAGIYAVSTLPEERRKGLGAAVTAGALRAARGEGYRLGVLQSSPMGAGVYRGLGFAPCGSVWIYIRMPEAG